MKILVLGKNGMLGHVVFNYFLEQGYEIFGTGTHGDTIFYNANQNMAALEDILKKYQPDVVINCIGILNQVAEDSKVMAVRLNSLLPHYIDGLSKSFGFKFIHVSTDCVFEGTIGKYDEFAIPDATSFYGRSKALGEINNNSNVTLRTSIIGPDNNPNGIGLFEWFITQTNKVGGYSKVIWTGVTTIELAKAMEKAIKYNLVGLQHVVNNTFISKKELLELFKKYFYKNIEIEENASVVSEKTLIRTEKSFDFEVPSYEQMIDEMAQWVLQHQDLYSIILRNSSLGGKHI